MCSNISSTTLHSWRERHPSSYSIKVTNLYELERSTLYSDGKYQSRRFSSGDYKCLTICNAICKKPRRLIIYPNGNDEDNGSGFISMYVEIDSTSLMSTTSTEVYADLRFYVFNKKVNKYFTIQDVDSKPFNTLRTVWGLPRVLALDTFKDHKNGYLFDGDNCEFGANIIVAPPPIKWEILSFDKNFLYPKFSWSVKNFSKIKENTHTSDNFSKGGKKWVLKLYPKGYLSPDTDSKWFSIYLFLADGGILKEDENIYVQTNVKVEDPFGFNHLTRKLHWWIVDKDSGRGWNQLVSTTELRKSYLDKEDTLKVEIEFQVVSATKYSSIT